jgi:hypothetical protein
MNAHRMPLVCCVVGFLGGSLLGSAISSVAQTTSSQPFPRIEAGMHTAVIKSTR